MAAVVYTWPCPAPGDVFSTCWGGAGSGASGGAGGGGGGKGWKTFPVLAVNCGLEIGHGGAVTGLGSGGQNGEDTRMSDGFIFQVRGGRGLGPGAFGGGVGGLGGDFQGDSGANGQNGLVYSGGPPVWQGGKGGDSGGGDGVGSPGVLWPANAGPGGDPGGGGGGGGANFSTGNYSVGGKGGDGRCVFIYTPTGSPISYYMLVDINTIPGGGVLPAYGTPIIPPSPIRAGFFM